MEMELDAALQQLSELQRFIAARNEPGWANKDYEKLLFCPIGDLLHVEYYGYTYEESFEELTRVLSQADVAAHISSLVFNGPDVGANGTESWDFSALLESEVVFPHLRSLVVKASQPEDHNHIVLGGDEEDGQIARLLAKAPLLESLTVPSAPDATFFQVGLRPLKYLRLEAGWDTQNFILNFSQSSNFPELRVLDFSDYNQPHIEDYPAACTPFEHYKQMFLSEAFSSVVKFILRNSILTDEQLRELHNLKKSVALMILQTPQGKYVQ